MIRRRVMVAGVVQGVFFRDSCRQQAVAAGVAGWVRNLPDGRVEAVFEGGPAEVERLVEWCGRGPSRAVVEDRRVSEEPPEGLTGFEVRPTAW
ncbi:acylphosphatase [Streptomyces sp. NRRL B-24484]|uniref:acylphosphatase n=1 Tax=Streptomyces sp. NRRL B-24484 TaxID=1463833 RepID=UPI001F4012DD|nr:acylphosphatase [Streptomyces sp. NRRL B-24484]